MDCVILKWKPLRVEPENLPLDIVYEDENVLVLKKPACMSSKSLKQVLSDAEDISDDDEAEGLCSSSYVACVRPGAVHRLDKGNSGLLVVAKAKGRTFDVPVGRDVSDRIHMAAILDQTGDRSVMVLVETFIWYKVIEILAGGGSALVEWRLETGHTHQVRTSMHGKERNFSCPPPPDILSQIVKWGERRSL